VIFGNKVECVEIFENKIKCCRKKVLLSRNVFFGNSEAYFVFEYSMWGVRQEQTITGHNVKALQIFAFFKTEQEKAQVLISFWFLKNKKADSRITGL
jgi:hypothetical protein